MKLLYPDLYLESIHEIDLKKLHDNGIKGIITDLDNTLVGCNNEELSDRLLNWFSQIKDYNMSICIVSNNRDDRVYRFAKQVGIRAIPKAKKPRRKAFYQALDILNLSPKEVAVIGDQIFTDVLGGNRLGLFTVLVIPINQKEFIGTKVMRMMERIILKKIDTKIK